MCWGRATVTVDGVGQAGVTVLAWVALTQPQEEGGGALKIVSHRRQCTRPMAHWNTEKSPSVVCHRLAVRRNCKLAIGKLRQMEAP